MLDFLALFINAGIELNDSMAFVEQCNLLYGMFLPSDQFGMSDSLVDSLLVVLDLALADTETANWLDAILLEFIYFPGAITLQLLNTLHEMVVKAISAQGEITFGSLNSVPIDPQVSAQGQMTIEEISVELQNTETVIQVLV